MSKELYELVVPYSIALLAKEKGYDRLCLAYYGIENELIFEVSRNSDPNLKRRNFIAAPFSHSIIGWLLRQHNLYINIEYIDDIIGFAPKLTNTLNNTVVLEGLTYKSYYSALESIVEKSLYLIK